MCSTFCSGLDGLVESDVDCGVHVNVNPGNVCVFCDERRKLLGFFWNSHVSGNLQRCELAGSADLLFFLRGVRHRVISVGMMPSSPTLVGGDPRPSCSHGGRCTSRVVVENVSQW